MSTSYDICVYCCISNKTGATSGAGTGDYLYVCTFVYVIHCTGSIPNLKKMLRILMSNTMSILDDIFVCCLLITGVVQLVEQELFTISDVTPLFYIICSFLLLIVCFCSFSVDHCIVFLFCWGLCCLTICSLFCSTFVLLLLLSPWQIFFIFNMSIGLYMNSFWWKIATLYNGS